MADLFPDTLQPEAIGFGAVRQAAPCFFAIYPDEVDLPRIVEEQLRLCRTLGSTHAVPRPPGILHVSVAECGVPRRLREPLEIALLRARERFSYPAFELTLEATGCFGAGHDAFVAIADVQSSRLVDELRNALADAQQPFGLTCKRGPAISHLTLGYGAPLPAKGAPIPPIRFRVKAVDLVISHPGHTKHSHLNRWELH
jgi:RNA 2',3'-cyclic 3'-phosphodiesterase